MKEKLKGIIDKAIAKSREYNIPVYRVGNIVQQPDGVWVISSIKVKNGFPLYTLMCEESRLRIIGGSMIYGLENKCLQ